MAARARPADDSRATWFLPGSYIVALRLDAPRAIGVGRLGEFRFPAGCYLYAGSARGPGGLRARLARHRRRLGPAKQVHWHLDYLREWATWTGAWGQTGPERLECEWAAALRALPGAQIVASGFGAADCRCPAHLVYVPVLPGDDWFSTHLGAERIGERMTADTALDDLLATLVAGDDEAREEAALALGRHGQGALPNVAGLLEHSSAEVRWWAARALSAIGGEEAVPPLTMALGDTDPDVRACAALGLGHVGLASGATPLAARLADDSAFVAGIAADALAMIGPPAVDALLTLLEAEDARTRLLAVRALARVKDQRAIGPLFKMLDDPSYLVRFYADEALEALGVGMIYVTP